ncbi:MAG: hypothetical protein ACRDQH_06130 [Pseudonocardiaceae bacterium]
MKLIRFILRGLLTWSLLLFALGAAFAASPRAGEDLLGLLAFALLAGGLLSLLVRRPPAAPGSQEARPPAEAAPSVVETAAQHIPGAYGARMALSQQPAENSRPDAVAVCFRGQLKAYVTPEGWHPVGAFAELGAEDPEYRLVALMSVYAQSVLLASNGVYTEQDAIAYALCELVPHELLEHDLPDPSQTAAALCLPADVLTPQNLNGLRAALTERNAAHATAADPPSKARPHD